MKFKKKKKTLQKFLHGHGIFSKDFYWSSPRNSSMAFIEKILHGFLWQFYPIILSEITLGISPVMNQRIFFKSCMACFNKFFQEFVRKVFLNHRCSSSEIPPWIHLENAPSICWKILHTYFIYIFLPGVKYKIFHGLNSFRKKSGLILKFPPGIPVGFP